MKHRLYKWILLSLIIFTTINLGAQTKATCKRDFVIKTKVTESTCMANGVIEVTLEGDLTDLETDLTEYSLRPVDGTEGTSLQFSRNKVLRSITAGTYIVSVRTFCIEDNSIGVVTESTNVVVGGNYKPLMAEFDLARMRKSYPNCPTGLIAFNVKSGTGYGDLTFSMSKAPTGVAIGQLTPIKDAITGGYIQYTLPDNYPSGDYQIDVYDSCSKATMSFTLGETSGLPTPANGGSSFYPNSDGTSCSEVRWSPSSPSNNENDHFFKHFRAGFYEIALTPALSVPTESDWFVWTGATKSIYLPDSYKNYFAARSLQVHIRLKGCNEVNTTFATNIKTPYLSNGSPVYYCDHYTRSISSWADYDSFWCYPIEVSIIDYVTKEKLATERYEKPASRGLLTGFKYEYGKSYSFVLTDASDHVYTLNNGTTLNFGPTSSINVSSYGCDTFRGNIYSISNYSCYPIEIKVYKQNTAGTYELYEEISLTTSNSSPVKDYPYGNYRLDATYNHIKSDGTNYTYSRLQSITSPRPTSLTLTNQITTSSNSYENYGYLQITANATLSIGTRITVEDAPDAYRHKGRTFTTTSSISTFYLGNSDVSSTSGVIHMPTGNYTIRLQDDCGTNLTATAWFETGYNAQDVKYTIEDTGCEGALLKLDTESGGYVKRNGVASGSYTNFRVEKGPTGGYETTVKSYNQGLKIVADGEYIIATVVSSSYPTYIIRRDTIQFEKSKPVLDASVTSAYVCTDPDSQLGYMIFTGKGGKAPYRYELLDENKVATGLEETGNDGERVVFHYGLPGETYIVRITDECGNSTTQQMTLADLKTQSIIYSIPAEGSYCTGEELKLNCITLGQTSYLWEKKISEGVYKFVSNDQNPRIFPVTEADGGVYRVTVTPEYCGEAITGEVTVVVFPPLTAGTVSADQEICVATRANTMSCPITGGKGNYSYQWQMSTDQTNWTNVVNGTTSTLAPLHARSGIYYYRLQVTDDCITVSSDVITLNVKACYIMINPNTRSIAR